MWIEEDLADQLDDRRREQMRPLRGRVQRLEAMIDGLRRYFQTLAPRDEVEGSGIGLSIVKKIVESRGGRAWIESAPGAGAAFHFLWPRQERSPAG